MLRFEMIDVLVFRSEAPPSKNLPYLSQNLTTLISIGLTQLAGDWGSTSNFPLNCGTRIVY